MTNREFDLLMRTTAQKEAFQLTEQTENNIKNKISEAGTAKRVRRFTTRTVLIAALVTILLVTTALAVSNLPGVVELMNKIGWASDERMEHIKEQTAQPMEQVCELADVTITLSEIVYDGSRLYASIRVSPKVESNVVLLTMTGNPSDTYDFDDLRGKEPPEGAKTNAEVAKERGARLLRTNVFLDAPRSGSDGTGMDYTSHSDGAIDYMFELENTLTDETNQIPVELYASQCQVTDEGVPLESTWLESTWTLSVPALIQSLATATPTPTLTPKPTSDVLRLIGTENTRLTDAYQAVYPDRQLTYAEWTSTDGQELTAELLSETVWDVYALSTDDPLFWKLMESGAMYDFSGNEVLSAWAARLHKPIQEALSSNSKLYALPVSLWPTLNGDYLFSREPRFSDFNSWRQAGLTDEDMPVTADELFTLIEKYASLLGKQRKELTFSSQSQNARRWLLNLVMNLYVAQADGAPATFQTDELRGLLDRMNQAGNALKGEKGVGYAVLQEGNLLQCAEHAVSLRLFEDSPRRVYARMDVLIVNPNSSRLSQAMDFVEAALNHMDWENRAKMDARITFDELNDMALEQHIADTQKWAAWYQSRADSAPDEVTRKEEQANADAQLESIDYVKELAQKEGGVIPAIYLTYLEDIEAYRKNLAPYLTFDYARAGTLLYRGEAYAALKNRYLTNELDTNEFLRRLDELLR